MVRVLWRSILLNSSNPDTNKKDILSKSADDTELGLDYKESQGFYSKEPQEIQGPSHFWFDEVFTSSSSDRERQSSTPQTT